MGWGGKGWELVGKGWKSGGKGVGVGGHPTVDARPVVVSEEESVEARADGRSDRVRTGVTTAGRHLFTLVYV